MTAPALHRHRPGCPVEPTLSDKEETIAGLLATGQTRTDIGKVVFLGVEAVKDHTDRIRDHHEACSRLNLRRHDVLVAYLARLLARD